MDIDEFTVEEREVAEIMWFPKDEMIAHMKSNPDDYLPSTVKWVMGLSDA